MRRLASQVARKNRRDAVLPSYGFQITHQVSPDHTRDSPDDSVPAVKVDQNHLEVLENGFVTISRPVHWIESFDVAFIDKPEPAASETSTCFVRISRRIRHRPFSCV